MGKNSSKEGLIGVLIILSLFLATSCTFLYLGVKGAAWAFSFLSNGINTTGTITRKEETRKSYYRIYLRYQVSGSELESALPYNVKCRSACSVGSQRELLVLKDNPTKIVDNSLLTLLVPNFLLLLGSFLFGLIAAVGTFRTLTEKGD